ncbi:MAG: phosphotransferase [Candidatus Aminicenantes bacterium]|jgi:aminoglycoside phosphotransferase (APT) family kinase protein
MDKKIIDHLEEILRRHFGTNVTIESTSPVSIKPLRTVFLIEAVKENLPVSFILHVRQRPSRDNQEEEFKAINTAISNGVFTFELIHYDKSRKNPFGASFLLESYIQGENFLKRKDWFKQHPQHLFNTIERLHHIKCERKSSAIPDFKFLPKYKNECLMKLVDSTLVDVKLLEKMFEEVNIWQKEIDFSSHTSLLHGDLHYSNIFITDENRVYLIDWEMTEVGDYCKDLSYFKARTLDYLYPEDNQSLFDNLMTNYKKAFDEDDLEIRMRYYLSYRYLEIIWRCCFPRLSEQWLPFYFQKYCDFRRSFHPRSILHE